MITAAAVLIAVAIAVVAINLLTSQPEDDSQSTQWGNSAQLKQWLTETEATTTEQLNQLSKEIFTQTYNGSNISFRYPEEFKVGEFPSGDQQVIVVQHPQQQVGVQVTITSLEEEINLTEQLIKEELADYSVINPQPVVIADQQQGLTFKSENDWFGNSREIWFTYKQNLYQITSYASLDPFVKTFFKTWKFQ